MAETTKPQEVYGLGWAVENEALAHLRSIALAFREAEELFEQKMKKAEKIIAELKSEMHGRAEDG